MIPINLSSSTSMPFASDKPEGPVPSTFFPTALEPVWNIPPSTLPLQIPFTLLNKTTKNVFASLWVRDVEYIVLPFYPSWKIPSSRKTTPYTPLSCNTFLFFRTFAFHMITFKYVSSISGLDTWNVRMCPCQFRLKWRVSSNTFLTSFFLTSPSAISLATFRTVVPLNEIWPTTNTSYRTFSHTLTSGISVETPATAIT